jgi:SLOG cluster2/TIR domain
MAATARIVAKESYANLGNTPTRLFVISHPKFPDGTKIAESLYKWFGGPGGEAHRTGIGVPVHPWSTFDPERPPDLPPRQHGGKAIVLALVDAEFAARAPWRGWLDLARERDDLLLHTWAIHEHAAQSPSVGGRQLIGSGEIDERALRRRLTEEVAVLLLATETLNVFISYSRSDGGAIAKEIDAALRCYLRVTPFLDVHDIIPGSDWNGELRGAIDSGAGMLAIVTDDYSSRPWCREELREFREPTRLDPAKPPIWMLRPVFLVDALKGKRTRSMFEVGSIPAARYDSERIVDIVDEFMRELMMGAYLARLAKLERSNLMNSTVVSVHVINWSPDTWSLLRILRAVEGPLDAAIDVIYPGDGLPIVEARRLEQSFPNVRLRSFADVLTNETMRTKPITGRPPVVIFSVSDPPAEHLLAHGSGRSAFEDLVLRLGRIVIRREMNIAYGGLADKGFTDGLQDDGGTVSLAPCVINVLGWPYADDLAVKIVADNLGRCRYVKVPWGGPSRNQSDAPDQTDPLHRALAASATRQAIAFNKAIRDIDDNLIGRRIGHIAIGGKLAGYAGLLPGIIEEVTISIERALPIYLIGGFGGAAGVMADIVLGRTDCRSLEGEIDRLRRSALAEATAVGADRRLREQRCLAIDTLASRRHKQLARTVIAANTLRSAADPGNGLTWLENEDLMTAVDPTTIVRLIASGLTRFLSPDVWAGSLAGL